MQVEPATKEPATKLPRQHRQLHHSRNLSQLHSRNLSPNLKKEWRHVLSNTLAPISKQPDAMAT